MAACLALMLHTLSIVTRHHVHSGPAWLPPRRLPLIAKLSVLVLVAMAALLVVGVLLLADVATSDRAEPQRTLEEAP